MLLFFVVYLVQDHTMPGEETKAFTTALSNLSYNYPYVLIPQINKYSQLT